MLKVLSLFSGIGAFEKALDNLEVPYELTAFCEFDKYAVKSYCAIHNVDESKNLGDITKVDESTLPKDIDILTYGFPCQDISISGKQKGMFNDDGSLTRSGLFFEALRIIEATKPKIAIAENVKNLVSKKFNAQFQVVLASLDHAGYNNYYQVMNSKDFGVPQNRERVFIVSIRKDIDTGLFEFPKPFPLEKRLKDLLEDVVDEKYYLSDEFMSRFVTSTQSEKYPCGNEYTVLGTTKAETDRMGTNSRHWVYDIEGCMSTLDATQYKQPKQILVEEPTVKQVGQMYPEGGNPQSGRVYDANGISPTMDTCSGGNRMPKVVEPVHLGNIYGEQFGTGYAGNVWDKESISPTLMTMQGGNRQPFIVVDGDVVKVREATKRGYAEAHDGDSINLEQPNSTTRRGRVGEQVAQTLNTTAHLQATVVDQPTTLRIRKLTPKECFRLMGFDDESFHKAEAVNSNTQLYKQAGNSIVVDVLEELFCMMLDENGELYV